MAKKKVTTVEVVEKSTAPMGAYEVCLVVSPNTNESDREKITTWLRKLVMAWGGQVDKTEEAGKKVLAYPIKKFNEAWYFFYDVHLPSDKAEDLNLKINFEESVIRHLVVKAEK